MSDRPTPETNEAQFGTGRVSVDFARKLERERDEARELARELRDALDTLGLVVGLTAFKHESQRLALQEALDASRQVITKAKEVLP